MPIRIFISHASGDRDLVKYFVRVLETSLVIPDEAIRCSSLPGYRFRAGAHSSTVIRSEIDEATVIVGILTPDGLESGWVMFELGAAWGKGKCVMPVVAGIDYDNLPGPLNEINATDAADHGELQQFLQEISKATGLPRRTPGTNTEALDELVAEAEEYFEDDDEDEDGEEEEEEDDE